MTDLMTPEDRVALLNKLSAKVNDMADDELKDLAKELGLDETPADSDAPSLKPLAAVMPKPVDTGVLTGPRDGLKNFLLKSERNNEAKS